MSEPYTAGLKRVTSQVPKGMLWQYRVSLRGDYPHPEHIWMLVSEAGGIHVSTHWSSFGGSSEWLGGIECHYATAPDYMSDKPPHHERCWVIQKPCWHDGTSLGFSEQIAPFLPSHTNAFDESDHAMVLSVMLHWHRTHFPASVDTHPKDGDALAAPLVSGAVGEAETPK